MDDQTTRLLLEINRQFYSQFGAAFAATRRRLQDGVRRVLAGLPDRGLWLDLGCGSGTLAAEWLRRGRQSAYMGLDNSPELVAEARQAVEFARLERVSDEYPADFSISAAAAANQVSFVIADLADPAWSADLLKSACDGVLCFAVLHHLPGEALRRKVLSQIRQLLAPGGELILSVWQFHHSPRLVSRVQPWSSVGLSESAVDPGDTLLDWRGALPGQGMQVGLRYVHLFTPAELAELAAGAGFRMVDQFYSDGEGGRLSLYQHWRLE